MTVFWLILALVTLACLLAGSGVAFSARRSPSWHPGDDLPDVPEDSPIREVRW